MNKLLIVLVGCFFSTAALAQKKTIGIRVNPYAGYETNLLKSPAFYEPTNGEEQGREDLWVNAPLVGLNNRFSLYGNNKRHGLVINGNYKHALVPEEKEVSASDLLTDISYRFNNRKKVKNNLKFGFRNYIKTGEDQDNLIGVPLSYRRIDFSNELNLKLSKKWAWMVQPNATLKMYQREGFSRFTYLENGIRSGLTYRYNLKRKVGFALYGDVHQRNYVIQKSDEQIGDSTNRIWRYYSGGLGMRIPANDKLKFLLRADYTFRKDVLQSKLGYHQYAMRVGMNYKHKKWKADITTSAFFRDYTNFMVTIDEEKEGLNYRYLKYQGTLQYAVTNNFALVLRSSAKARMSNANDPSRRAFRSYLIGAATVGFVWNIKPNQQKRQHKALSGK